MRFALEYPTTRTNGKDHQHLGRDRLDEPAGVKQRFVGTKQDKSKGILDNSVDVFRNATTLALFHCQPEILDDVARPNCLAAPGPAAN